MHSLSPYLYKRQSLAETEHYNRLFEKDPGLTIRLGPDQFAIVFEPGNSNGWTPSPLKAHLRMDARIGFELHAQERMLVMMLGDIASVQDLTSLSEQLRCAALEAGLEKVLDLIDHISGARSTIDGLCETPVRTGYTKDLFFSLIRKRDGLRGRGYIRTDIAGLDWIAARLSRLSSETARRLNHLPVTGLIEIGRSRVTPAELDSLEPLDIVLAEEAAVWNERRVFIKFSPGLTLAGNILQPDRFLIQDLATGERKAYEMTNMKTNAAAATQWPAEDIPIDLVFEIGRTQMLMGELRRLQAGYTVQLKETVDVQKPVIVKANGVPVANGEIVLIDDRLGIRILDFNRDVTPAASE